MIDFNYNPIPHDTSEEAARVQAEIYRNMSPDKRSEIAFDLSEGLRQTVRAGIKDRHPYYSEEQISQAYLTLIMDKEIVKQAYGGQEIEP